MSRVRPATTADIPAIKAMAVSTGMFAAEETGFVDETAQGVIDGSLPDHRWLVWTGEDGAAIGAAYYAPEPFSDRMWNLYFLSVAPAAQGQGVGRGLVAAVEQALLGRGPDVARTLIIETSSTDQYARTRAFYPTLGYVEEARIREFYGPGDHKVVFWKSLC